MRIFAYLFGGRKAGAAAARGKQAGREARWATAPAGADRGQHGGCVPAGEWQHGESRQRWQACARKGWSADPAEQPTLRSAAEGGGSGVGTAAKALQRGGLPALAALSVLPLLAHCLRAALPLLAWPKAAVALRASLPACEGAALGRAAAAPACRPPPFASALAAAFSFPPSSMGHKEHGPTPSDCTLAAFCIANPIVFILSPGNILGLTPPYIRHVAT